MQVTQQRLEGLGLVFASATAHATAAEAWRAIGPVSMARQVVGAVNTQLGELAAHRAELRHDLAAAKERWQLEEGVRIRWAGEASARVDGWVSRWEGMVAMSAPDLITPDPGCLGFLAQAAGAAAGGEGGAGPAGQGAGRAGEGGGTAGGAARTAGH